MTVSAEVLADSVHPLTHSRLTTMRIVIPRVLWDEFLTHRSFSRNAASQRAIPTKRQRSDVLKDPFVPPSFGANQPGMQQGADLSRIRAFFARGLWSAALYAAVFFSWALDTLGVHKQLASRVLFPFVHITAIISGTDVAFANFYALRRHPAAEPTIRLLAEEMAKAHRASVPRRLELGEWHLPLVTDGRGPSAVIRSVARCARTSYNRPDTGKPSTLAEDVATCKKLLDAKPPHASPAEHQARATTPGPKSGNFGDKSGWEQYRKTLAGECATDLFREMS